MKLVSRPHAVQFRKNFAQLKQVVFAFERAQGYDQYGFRIFGARFYFRVGESAILSQNLRRAEEIIVIPQE